MDKPVFKSQVSALDDTLTKKAVGEVITTSKKDKKDNQPVYTKQQLDWFKQKLNWFSNFLPLSNEILKQQDLADAINHSLIKQILTKETAYLHQNQAHSILAMEYPLVNVWKDRYQHFLAVNPLRLSMKEEDYWLNESQFIDDFVNQLPIPLIKQLTALVNEIKQNYYTGMGIDLSLFTKN